MGSTFTHYARLVLILALTPVFPCGAHAQLALPRSALPQTVRLHAASWHDRGEYNNANLGVGLRWDGGLNVPSGIHRALWDGQDSNGTRVMPGVYVLRLRGAATESRSMKAVVIN